MATVAFKAPASNGGRPITQYTAIARQDVATTGPGITASSTGSPISIGGLTDGTTYTVSVYATNVLGNSVEALAGAVVPLGPIGAPTGLSASVTPAGMHVSFTPPTATGGAPVDSYTVTSSPGGIKAVGTARPNCRQWIDQRYGEYLYRSRDLRRS